MATKVGTEIDHNPTTSRCFGGRKVKDQGHRIKASKSPS